MERWAFFCWLMAGLALSLAAPASRAEPPPGGRILIVADPDNGIHQRVLSSLREVLRANPGPALGLGVVKPGGGLEERMAARPAPDLIVTVGTAAARDAAALPRPHPPLLHALLPRSTYATLQAPEKPAPAIVLDQPLERRLNLLRLALPDSQRVAVLLGPTSRGLYRDLETAINHHWHLHSERVYGSEDILPALRKLLPGNDVFMALADPLVFNRHTVQGVLLTTYRQRVPVLAYSRNYVKAGALLAVYSTPEQIGRQLGEWLTDLAGSGRWQAQGMRYPRYFQVAVNPQVARSLGLKVPDETVLTGQLQAGEARP